MAAEQPDPDAFTRPFQLTKSMHRDVYKSVRPDNPDLKATGQVVLITGASGGVGYVRPMHHRSPRMRLNCGLQKTAMAWSTAGAAGIVLVGRTAASLEQAAKDLAVPHLVAPGDVTSSADARRVMDQAVTRFGKVDVLINSHGHMNDPNEAGIGKLDPDLWWGDFVGLHASPRGGCRRGWSSSDETNEDLGGQHARRVQHDTCLHPGNGR